MRLVANWFRPRSDRRHHFILGERLEEPGVPAQWHRRAARCAHCGEARRVFHAVPMHMLNVGPCEVSR